MSKQSHGTPAHSDISAMAAIEHMRQPLKMAVASVIWWDCVSYTPMSETYKAMNPFARPRRYPTREHLIEGLIQAGYTDYRANERVVDEDQLNKEKRKSMQRMRARRKAGKR